MFLGLDLWQISLVVLIILLLLNYIAIVVKDRLAPPVLDMTEGFTSSDVMNGWLDDPYDPFYAKVYHKIFKHDGLVQAEAAIALMEWKKKDPKIEDYRILDVACGTGVATCAFVKQGVGVACGLDKSVAMLNYANDVVLPATTLEDKGRVMWRNGDAYAPFIAHASEFTHACLFFFGIYSFQELEVLFKNLALWIKPGGGLVIEVVNKHKFEPVPDVSNPFLVVSPQKHSKERIMTSAAAFDKFDYATEFILIKDRAEFKETFTFKGEEEGKVRRQKHTLYMPSIAKIVAAAAEMGFKYTKFTDMQITGFNYGYLLFFERVLE
jgi:SAM-dependent methyltransferase